MLANGTDFAPAWANGFNESQLYVNGLECWLRWAFIREAGFSTCGLNGPELEDRCCRKNMAKAILGCATCAPHFFNHGRQGARTVQIPSSRFHIPDSKSEIQNL